MASEFEWDEGVVKTWTERHDDATDHKEGDAHPKKPKTKPPAGWCHQMVTFQKGKTMKVIPLKSTAFAALAVVACLTSGALAHGASSPLPHDSPPDVAFLDMMILHHRQGVEMARLAETKGQLPRLREFAAKVAARQERDIKKLREIREQLYGDVEKADAIRLGGRRMTMPEMRHAAEEAMKKLQAASGSEFDRTLIDAFTKHHQLAIQMSKETLSKGHSAEVKREAQKTIDKQSQEIEEMAQMRDTSGEEERPQPIERGRPRRVRAPGIK